MILNKMTNEQIVA